MPKMDTPQIILDQTDEETPDVVEVAKEEVDNKNQEHSGDRNKDCQIMQIIIPALKRQKSKRRKRRTCKASSLQKLPIAERLSSNPLSSEIRIPEGEFFQFLKEFEVTIATDDGGKDCLHFNNPTVNLCTRCDVVYKTILRDCRKYFCELFVEKSGRRSRDLVYIFELIDDFVNRKFPDSATEAQDEMKFYLRCFVKHKMNSFNRSNIQLPQKYQGDSLQNSKAKRLHEILYKFSLEKLEEFFSNESLTKLFYQYMKHFQRRLEFSEVMKKSRNVYFSALKLILMRTQTLMF
ncbi:unnamed protein product [Moneuplotes crassus]|uniref:Uncharacterized protein n=2 Tax=Euplotes crassus TaxID=5936 RepID=A0AAD1Y7H3_EUPCR|nr:unnamed protein product [Moneuplotes crassus]